MQTLREKVIVTVAGKNTSGSEVNEIEANFLAENPHLDPPLGQDKSRFVFLDKGRHAVVASKVIGINWAKQRDANSLGEIVGEIVLILEGGYSVGTTDWCMREQAAGQIEWWARIISDRLS